MNIQLSASKVCQLPNNDKDEMIISLSFHALIAITITMCSLGGIVGFIFGRRRCASASRNSADATTTTASTTTSTTASDETDNAHESYADEIQIDGPTLVLRGSLELMASRWGGKKNNGHHPRPVHHHQQQQLVVEYLSPEKMTKILFSSSSSSSKSGTTVENALRGGDGSMNDGNEEGKDEMNKKNLFHSLCLDDEDYNESSSLSSSSPSSSSLIVVQADAHSSSEQQQSQAFIHLLSLIQKYSVNTSHPYFFNQLFGSLDPIALAAEIVALSVNTSVYTYETAPVFTLLEREVMGQIGKLVFEHRHRCCSSTSSRKERREFQQIITSTQIIKECFNDEGINEHIEDEVEEEEEFMGEGLMIPGGSLANLTAMHAARHRWKVRNGYTRRKRHDEMISDGTTTLGHHYPTYRTVVDHEIQDVHEDEKELVEEEKKMDDGCCCLRHPRPVLPSSSSDLPPFPHLVALVSSEAHYSFAKSARILGLREEDLIVIPTHADGKMDVTKLAKKLEELEWGSCFSKEKMVGNTDYTSRSYNLIGGSGNDRTRKKVRVPFFVACTAGSTVRGSFDDIAAIVQVCREYEARGNHSDSSSFDVRHEPHHHRSIWIHVDGAWGGSAIFSSRPSLRSVTHMDEIRHADSFTFNPHKMLGAPQQTTAFIVRHRNALRDANAAGAKYLFDPRKNGAEYDLGDLSYTCGRRTDAVKLWALWKYYGRAGLGSRVDQKVDELALFVEEMRKRPSFALACKPWPFNVNFFYFPPRIRRVLEARGIIPLTALDKDTSSAGYVQIPDDIAKDLANVSVQLKLRMHEAGEMIIPYQPLSNQNADCFRLVLAGKKSFGMNGIQHVLDTMEKYGADL